MLNLCSSLKHLYVVQIVKRLMKDRGIKKIPGCSWIEGCKLVHFFV